MIRAESFYTVSRKVPTFIPSQDAVRKSPSDAPLAAVSRSTKLSFGASRMSSCLAVAGGHQGGGGCLGRFQMARGLPRGDSLEMKGEG